MMNWLVRFAAIVSVGILFAGCASGPRENPVDAHIAAVSTGGLRLGMTPAEVAEVSSRRLYKEDERNQIRLPDLVQKERDKATIRLERVRSISTVSPHETYAFYSNAITLTLQFARNRLVEIEERHTGLGEEDLRGEMKTLSTQFKFVSNRLDTGSAAQWTYQGENRDAHVRIDFRFVTTTRARPTPISSYTIVLADSAWATASKRTDTKTASSQSQTEN